ncbi:THEX1 [Lepeophtheirus salmonis]|uniref:THEX1 n=1 Tax=Lepeophtheirus salmonis TaxID=72036 RepID=A0A7R8D7K7_LEPSM|nr:THEX1 [Lepeophtheirus salmonis]CAF3000972.1 THEX1 [Lepeophtheirus salmonis]
MANNDAGNRSHYMLGSGPPRNKFQKGGKTNLKKTGCGSSMPPEQQKIYQEISKLNGLIDQMTNQKEEAGLAVNSNVHYFVDTDYEATSKERNLLIKHVIIKRNYKHEIIEFPAVLISSRTVEVVDTFLEYIRPFINPNLSTFCKNLTGILQKMTSTPGLHAILTSLGMEFEGSPDYGINDAKNISRIIIRLLKDQAYIGVNEKNSFGCGVKHLGESFSCQYWSTSNCNGR